MKTNNLPWLLLIFKHIFVLYNRFLFLKSDTALCFITLCLRWKYNFLKLIYTACQGDSITIIYLIGWKRLFWAQGNFSSTSFPEIVLKPNLKREEIKVQLLYLAVLRKWRMAATKRKEQNCNRYCGYLMVKCKEISWNILKE